MGHVYKYGKICYLLTRLVVVIGMFSSCLRERNPQLHRALVAAGENRLELEKVLSHYKNDSLKLKAAEYLISNMPYHETLETYLLSPSGEKTVIDVDQFEDRGKVYWHLDSLYKLGYQRKMEKRNDVISLNADFLIRNIDVAFLMWQKPWARNVSFDDFCRWILPYRVQEEEIPIGLREKMIDRYLPLLDSAQVTTPLEACRVINKRFSEEFVFKDMMSPHYPKLEETLKRGYDGCVGLCNLNIFIMRALGIPVTSDYTTWTHMNQGHLWCVVFSDGKAYPYDDGNKYFLDYLEFLEEEEVCRPAKVYRTRFDPFHINHIKDRTIASFFDKVQDVTDSYLGKIHDIEINIDKNLKSESDEVFLCTYNCRRWQPLAIGKRKGNLCTFKNVAGNNFFIVADVPTGKQLRFITVPFYSDTTGYVRKFLPERQNISYTFSIEDMKLYRSLYLSYWNPDSSQFVKIDYDLITDSTRVYEQIPKNSLMVFLIPTNLPHSDRNRPLFFVEGDSICSIRSDLSRN